MTFLVNGFISGFTFSIQNGALRKLYRFFSLISPDYEQASKSVARLKVFDIGTVITYHGGVNTERIKERLTEIADG
ncbi:hypothetical protein [Paenibacillus sp. sgz5001063]|uniref:hypothetical protein n=1 Tax=Paenibacillus sp. sgz5001063 TaxID=3242474 RepID=UPI0036D3B7A0